MNIKLKCIKGLPITFECEEGKEIHCSYQLNHIYNGESFEDGGYKIESPYKPEKYGIGSTDSDFINEYFVIIKE